MSGLGQRNQPAIAVRLTNHCHPSAVEVHIGRLPIRRARQPPRPSTASQLPVSPHPTSAHLNDLLPLKAVDFLVLLMLAHGDRHGYGIMQDVERHTNSKVQLEAGSLYRTIRRLQDDGLLVESGRRPAADRDDERRRYYRLTPMGRKVVGAEAARLRALVRLAESAQLLAPDGGG